VTVIVYTHIFYKPQQGGNNITYNLYTKCVTSNMCVEGLTGEEMNKIYFKRIVTVSTDSVSAASVIRGLPRPETNFKIKEINGL
jgi:hypothetical protein